MGSQYLGSLGGLTLQLISWAQWAWGQLPGKDPLVLTFKNPFAEAVMNAEVLYNDNVMFRAKFANRSEYSSTFRYKKPEVYSIIDTPLSEDVSNTEVPSQFEDLPKVETSKSEISFGSDESSTLEETSMSEAFTGLTEPSNLELSSMPEVEAKSKYFLDGDFSHESFLEEEPQVMPLELLPGLQDPFAEVEAKLARLSSTVAAADVHQADVPKVPTQVPDVMHMACRNSVGRARLGSWRSLGVHRGLTSVAPASPPPPPPPPWWLWLGGRLRVLVFRGLGKRSSAECSANQ